MENENKVMQETAVNMADENETKQPATEDRCPKCQALIGEGQTFCPECGTSFKKLCPNCKSELRDGQSFCPECGQKVEVCLDSNENPAISRFNSDVEKRKRKSKVLPVVLTIILIIAGIGGYFTYYSIQSKNREEKIKAYLDDAKSFYSSVIISGSNMETVGNAIQSAWKKYINSSSYGAYYNGEYIYSVDSAVEAAQNEQSGKISSVRSGDSSIASTYKSLLTIPETENQELQEIKDTVKDVYDAYKNMYDCVITPSGNYSSWTSDFSDADSKLGSAIKDLGGLLN